ncbi:MAG TPA: cupredoxin domain-containing protein [Thermoanaerobaculia bacterium]|nr:cupredoxin domain-containing protein [Thermoanaerobaculia bacterium]
MSIARFVSCTAVTAALLASASVRRASADAPAPRVVEVTARRFEFTPAAIRLRKGETVTLRLRTLDVRHGLFSRPLGIDAEFEPGAARDVTITPRETGTFVVICDRFCGSGHGNMKIAVVVE